MKDTAKDFNSLLKEIAHEADSIEDACSKFKSTLLENPKLLMAWARETTKIDEWAYDQIRHQYRAVRRQLYYSPNYDKGGNQESMMAHTLNFRLPNGVRIMDATIDQLNEAAQFYITQGQSMINIGQRYEKLAKLVKKRRKKVVGNACTEEEIAGIFNLKD